MYGYSVNMEAAGPGESYVTAVCRALGLPQTSPSAANSQATPKPDFISRGVFCATRLLSIKASTRIRTGDLLLTNQFQDRRSIAPFRRYTPRWASVRLGRRRILNRAPKNL